MYRNLTMLYIVRKASFGSVGQNLSLILSEGEGGFIKNLKNGIHYTIIRRIYLAMCLCWSGRLLCIIHM